MTPPEYTPEDRPVAALLAPDILALLDDSPTAVAAETEELHAADLADVTELIPREKVAVLLAALPPQRAADVLEYLDEDLRAEVLEAMSARQAAALVSEMTPDDRADTLEEIEEERAEEILAAIPAEARRETEQLLAYDPDTAGGLMTTEFVSVPASMAIEAALAAVRTIARSGRREAMYQIYVTDETGQLSGVLSLRELLAAPEGAKVGDVAWTEVVTIPAQADREEVARVISNYDLVAVPVVDDAHRVLGVVTVDDVIDAIQEEQTEDVQKLGGMEALDEPYMTVGFWRMVKKRGGWLSFLFLSEMFTASAMGHYAGDVTKVVALALFIPLVMSSGGNSGSQATSLIIRAMAIGEIRLRDWWRVALREIPTGIAMGAGLCILGIARILLWQEIGLYNYGTHYALIAVTVGLALIGIVTWGSLAGSMLPFVMKRLGFDPASASAPFVATLVDVTGLVIFFSVAQIVLNGTLL
ncbi:MAG: magnesium transporter [Gemmatimonadota bacterium]|nr:magnesium transporter [Gemmatimonadota bacterium]HEU4989635.1 magnesium transporter [Gemmatimonadaceae bacterium]